MRKIRLIWVGKSKDGFIRDGIDKYLKLLKPYVRVELIELKEAKDGDRETLKRREGQRILEKASSFVLLDEGGIEMTSLEFTSFLKDFMDGPVPLHLVIGGVYGVDGEVRQAARKKLSLSRMTLTHQMVRITLLEQIYRAFTIIKGKAYHY